MATRIWLKKSAEASLSKTDQRKWDKDVYMLDGMEVIADNETGEKYIVLNSDPLDPAAGLPHIDRRHIKRVTYTGKYYEGFRIDGLYRFKGATARVETVKGTQGYGEATFERMWQTISISAGGIRTLREIYTQVRQGNLKPVEDWGAPVYELERRARALREHEAEHGLTEH